METKIGIIGAGAMGEAIATGLLASKLYQKENIILAETSAKRRVEIQNNLGLQCIQDCFQVTRLSEILILAVKPKQASQVLKEISTALRANPTLLISVIAGLSLATMHAHTSKGQVIIRAMPNLAVALQKGMTALAASTNASLGHITQAEELFLCLGRVLRIDENQLDTITAIAGSGPAYFYYIIEALANAGLALGLPHKLGIELAAQTMLGASSVVLQSSLHPSMLRARVSTPGGTTTAGLLELEKGRLGYTLYKAVAAAHRRSKQMGRAINK